MEPWEIFTILMSIVILSVFLYNGYYMYKFRQYLNSYKEARGATNLNPQTPTKMLCKNKTIKVETAKIRPIDYPPTGEEKWQDISDAVGDNCNGKESCIITHKTPQTQFVGSYICEN